MNILASSDPWAQNDGWRKWNDPISPTRLETYQMSQIIGIIHKNGIVIAADSQYTLGKSRQLDAEKISIIRFNNGDAIVAQAGNVRHSSLAIRYMEEMAQGLAIDDRYTVAKIAQEAIRKVRMDLLKSMQPGNYSLEEQAEFFNDVDNKFGLMVAYYKPESDNNDAVPYLGKITLAQSIMEEFTAYGTMGAAENIADFLLRQYKCEDMVWGEAYCLAMDVQERIKSDNIYCGGMVRIAFIHPTIVMRRPTAAIFEDDLAGRALEKFKPFWDEQHRNYKAGLGRIMQEIHNENYERIMQEMATDEKQEEDWQRQAAPLTVYKMPTAENPENQQNTDIK